MGNGISTGSSSPRPETSAKLIGLDGELKEFFYPITVSNLLQTTSSSSESFICNSDEMEFYEFISAMNGDEELRPGHLYFELPLTQLTRRLQAEDISALAIKANAAFQMKKEDDVRCGWCYYYYEVNNKKRQRVVFSNDDDDLVVLNGSGDLILDGPACDVQYLYKKKTAKLGVIVEEEEE